MRKISYLFILCMFVTILASLITYANNDMIIKISINGEYVEFNDDLGYPFIDSNSRTQVPFRVTLEKFGAKVSWDGENDRAVAEKDGIKVEVPISEKYIFKNGEKIENDTKALIKNSRTYLPIRVVMEAFECEVGWDGEANTVIIKQLNIVKDYDYVNLLENHIDSFEVIDENQIRYTANSEIPYDFTIYIPNELSKGKVQQIFLNRYDAAGDAEQFGVIGLGVDIRAEHTNPKKVFLKDQYFLLPFYEDGYVDDQYRQPHKNLEKIIDITRAYLDHIGYTTEKRVIMRGFSGAAIFAQRFAVLSPEYVKAIVAGQSGGILLMPFEEIDGYTMEYPLGISNYADSKINGELFNQEAYRNIYQLIHISNIDSGCTAVSGFIKTDEDMSFLVNKFGLYDPERLYRQTYYLKENGYNRVNFMMVENNDIDNAHIGISEEIENEFIRRVIDGTIDDYLNDYNTPIDDIELLIKADQVLGDRNKLYDWMKSLLKDYKGTVNN